jgi:two-component system, sensor histidine kinase and response regulator
MTQMPITPEILVPKIGDYLVEKKYLSPEQLTHALLVQRELKSSGKSVLLGELLIELGYIDRKKLDQSITEQIVQLRNALEEANRTLEQRVIQRTIELQEALNKLSELDKLKSNIIANISHELRTPLTHIKGYQELLLAGAMGDLNPEQESTLKTIRRSTERLERLIEDLINFSQISRGEISLRLGRVEMNRVAENVLNHSMLKAEDKHIQIQKKFTENLLAVNVDEEKISWVIMQLIDNAIKFTPENGQITIRLENRVNGVLAAVEDTGIGIAADKINEIFEPFHQLDGSSTRRFGGTGLGLSLVRQIIQAHHTKIEVSSEPGKGSKFEFLLPLYQKTAPLINS